MATKAPTSTTPSDASGAPLEALGGSPGTQALVPINMASGAVALPAELAEELAQEARDAAAQERPQLSRISLRNGMLSFMGNYFKDNRTDVLVLAAGFWNKFYECAFDPNNIVNPTCFAVSDDADVDMVPHENVEEPQNETCKGCPKFEWGSDPRPNSKGKACKETRRLIVMPADALASVEAIQRAEFALVDVPVTSVKNYANFVNTLSAAVKRPMYTVVTSIFTVPDPKTQFQLKFEPKAVVNDGALIQALRARLEQAKLAAIAPYDEAYLQGASKEQGTGQGAPVAAPASTKTAKFKG